MCACKCVLKYIKEIARAIESEYSWNLLNERRVYKIMRKRSWGVAVNSRRARRAAAIELIVRGAHKSLVWIIRLFFFFVFRLCAFPFLYAHICVYVIICFVYILASFSMCARVNIVAVRFSFIIIILINARKRIYELLLNKLEERLRWYLYGSIFCVYTLYTLGFGKIAMH